MIKRVEQYGEVVLLDAKDARDSEIVSTVVEMLREKIMSIPEVQSTVEDYVIIPEIPGDYKGSVKVGIKFDCIVN